MASDVCVLNGDKRGQRDSIFKNAKWQNNVWIFFCEGCNSSMTYINTLRRTPDSIFSKRIFSVHQLCDCPKHPVPRSIPWKGRGGSLFAFFPRQNSDQAGWFKTQQFLCPEISNSDTVTCLGTSQQAAGCKGSPQKKKKGFPRLGPKTAW